jgi:hypothetical protein
MGDQDMIELLAEFNEQDLQYDYDPVTGIETQTLPGCTNPEIGTFDLVIRRRP